MEEENRVKQKKQRNKYKIATIILSIWVGMLIILGLSQIILNNNVKISYNGIEYENNYAYVNLLINNKTDNQVVFDEKNFSIKNTGNAKTSLNLYYEYNVYYRQTGSYILNSGEKVKIKLQFNKSDITSNTLLYYNGEKIAEL